MLVEILIIAGLILLNGVFSMSEIALVSSKKSRLEMIAKKGNKGAVVAGELLAEPTRFLSTVQIGITSIGILTGLFSGATISATLSASIATVPELAPYANTIAITLVVIVVTYLTLVFGELIPKRLGMGSPEKISSFVAIPMSFVSMISKPFVSLLSSSTHVIFRILNIKDDDNKVTEEEILALIDEGISTGAVDEIEQDLMENIFYLGDKRLEALMTHISDVISVPSTATKEDIVNTFKEHRYSVYPVYDGLQENIVGLISIKDVFVYPENVEFSVMKILKPIHFFPEYTKSFKVLEYFMESKSHHSILVDEFGSMLGLITMNDILNDIVGNLSEEESISYEFTKRDDNSWFADGMYPFVDFLKHFDIDDEPYRTSHFHTLAGFVIYKLKKMPTEGDILIWRKFKFEVVDMDNRRIDKLVVTEIEDEPKIS